MNAHVHAEGSEDVYIPWLRVAHANNTAVDEVEPEANAAEVFVPHSQERVRVGQ